MDDQALTREEEKNEPKELMITISEAQLKTLINNYDQLKKDHTELKQDMDKAINVIAGIGEMLGIDGDNEISMAKVMKTLSKAFYQKDKFSFVNEIIPIINKYAGRKPQ